MDGGPAIVLVFLGVALVPSRRSAFQSVLIVRQVARSGRPLFGASGGTFRNASVTHYPASRAR
jgi:hypothetical protein